VKVVLDFNLSAWIKGVEVDATSYEDAVSKLYQMSFEEILETGFSKDFTISDVDGQVIEKQVKVKVYDIEYDVEYGDESDYESPEAYIQFINSLPTALAVTLTVEPNDDLEELIADEILYFHKGKLLEHGPKTQVLDAPAMAETKQFLEFYGV
jgi:hypothetical protein